MREIAWCLVLTLAVGAAAPAATVAPVARAEIGLREREAVTKGLRHLARTQNAEGSWSSGGPYARNVGICALACTAFMANGSQPGRGEFGRNIDRGLEFVLANCRENGLIGSAGRTRMYEHGFATLFLGQAYGMTPRRDIGKQLRAAVKLILQAQKRVDGGWRYDPTPYDRSDISVTVCEIMALRSARNAGITVPKSSIDRAIDYVKKSCLPSGHFSYLLPRPGERGSPGSYALLSAGISSLYGAGEYDCPELKRAIVVFERETPRYVSRDGGISHYYFYAQYYAGQAAFHAGGSVWRSYYTRIRKELLATQADGGGWPSSTFGDTFATAMACLVLQLPYRYLPIFQRLGADQIKAKGAARGTP